MTYRSNYVVPVAHYNHYNAKNCNLGGSRYSLAVGVCVPDVTVKDILHVRCGANADNANNLTIWVNKIKNSWDAAFTLATFALTVPEVDGGGSDNHKKFPVVEASMAVPAAMARHMSGMTVVGDATYTISSNTVTVTNDSHGLSADDYVFIKDPGGVITQATYQVGVPDSDTFTFSFTASDQGSAQKMQHSMEAVTDGATSAIENAKCLKFWVGPTATSGSTKTYMHGFFCWLEKRP